VADQWGREFAAARPTRSARLAADEPIVGKPAARN
jgi:hypothetical protein